MILALFLLVSLAGIGAFLLTISTLQQESITADEQGARAYQAARTGLDWATYQILQDPGGAFTLACNSGSAAQNLTLSGGLAGFHTEIACQGSGPFIEGAASVRVYRVTATGCNRSPCLAPGTPGLPTYVDRQLQITLTN
jgi:MSHA biogenesis protein MshP